MRTNIEHSRQGFKSYKEIFLLFKSKAYWLVKKKAADCSAAEGGNGVSAPIRPGRCLSWRRGRRIRGLGVPRVDAGIDRAEEEVGTVTETYLRIALAQRQARERAEIGRGDGTGARIVVTACRVSQRISRTTPALLGEMIGLRAVRSLGFLAPEQESGVRAPIECQFAGIRISGQRRRRVP